MIHDKSQEDVKAIIENASKGDFRMVPMSQIIVNQKN
jgi:hypothetical protein